jgi:hypothetical protein
VGHVDYDEWFESVDIGSVPLSSVAYVVADLYRDLFEVCVPTALVLSFFRSDRRGARVTQRVGPRIRAVSPEWQIRSRDDSMGICFGQLRLARLYSYDYLRVYPEIVVVTPR